MTMELELDLGQDFSPNQSQSQYDLFYSANLVTWTNYSGIDPELNDAGQSNFNTAEFLTQPPVRYFIARINLTF